MFRHNGQHPTVLVPIILLMLSGSTLAASPSPQEDAPIAAPRAGYSSPQLAYLIRGGCTAGLDKVCHRNKKRKLICHCAS